MAKREMIIRQLLLLLEIDTTKTPRPKDRLPSQAAWGFDGSTFLMSVATQVSKKRFITYKQYAAIKMSLTGSVFRPQIDYCFHHSIPMPVVPAGFKWVGFSEENGSSLNRVKQAAALNQEAKEPTDSASKAILVGGTILDLTDEMTKPWGELLVDGDTLVFRPMRYPTTNIKRAGKFRWDKETTAWRHPGIYAETVDKVLATFSEVIVHESVDLALSKNHVLVELPENIADHGTMFEFQKLATQYLLSHKKCLLGLAPGLGKTLASIMAAQRLMKEGKVITVAIVAPKSLLSNWQDEIDKWIGESAIILHTDFTNQPLDADWYILTYGALSRGNIPEELVNADLVILDESILLKTHNRVKKAIDGKKRWVFKTKRVQVALEIAKSHDWVWLLSGGPTSKYVDDLWAQLHLLDQNRFSSYWRFADDYCIVTQNAWARKVTGNKPGAIDKIHDDFADLMFVRSQNQVLDLPEWVFEEIDIPMSRKQEKLYKEVFEDWVATLDTVDGEIKLFTPNVLSRIIRLTQIASNPILLGHGISAISPKWDAISELFKIRPLPAIVWTQYIETAKRVTHMLEREGYSVGMLIGETPANIRGDVVKAFQNGSLDVIVAHPKVGKFGLTLTRCRTAIYLESSYDGDDYYQSLHRIRRIGTTHSPLVITLKSIWRDGSPTVDHLVADVLAMKAETTFKITAAKLVSYLEGGEEL